MISIVVFIIGVVGGIIFSSGLNLFQANVLIDKKHKTTNEPSMTFDIWVHTSFSIKVIFFILNLDLKEKNMNANHMTH